jgi:phosphatidylinositol glycan class B
MLLSYIPFLIYGLRKASVKQKLIAGFAIIYSLVYSLPAHKEIRFLLPALQLLIPFCGLGVSEYADSKLRCRRSWIVSAFMIQVVAFSYFGIYHQRGQIGVMFEIRRMLNGNATRSVLFLTPCHATPYYSSLHLEAKMRFFDCSPRSAFPCLHIF